MQLSNITKSSSGKGTSLTFIGIMIVVAGALIPLIPADDQAKDALLKVLMIIAEVVGVPLALLGKARSNQVVEELRKNGKEVQTHSSP